MSFFQSEMSRDSRVLGRTVAGSVALIWQRVGQADAQALVEDANERETKFLIRWVWLGDLASSAARLDAARIDAIQRGEIVTQRAATPDGFDAAYTYIPIEHAGKAAAAIEIRESLEAEAEYLRRSIVQTLITTTTLVCVCSALAFALGAILVGRPVRSLVQQARRIGEGDLSARLSLSQRDEMSDLAREMNSMCERLAQARERLESETAARVAAVEQLRHADRLTAVGRMAAGIAHELGTPLNVIVGHAQIVEEEQPETKEGMRVIVEQARRVTTIIRQLLDFARPRAPDRMIQELHPIAGQVVTLLRSLAKKQGVELVLEGPEGPVSASVDAGQLHQALTNLVMNAIQSMPGGGVVRLRVRSEGEDAVVDVEDEGEGIAPEVRPRIFDPFFTTKAPGDGTGLGLSVAYGMMKEHGGFIELTGRSEGGSRFSIHVPRGSFA
ncbi:MAG: HAMP domain-containing histidine kinase [Deltaproteobacteria bacterium]|nr:HAMP domain-containing histidine kinase [Deltaproteobacteria bacterium]